MCYVFKNAPSGIVVLPLEKKQPLSGLRVADRNRLHSNHKIKRGL